MHRELDTFVCTMRWYFLVLRYVVEFKQKEGQTHNSIMWYIQMSHVMHVKQTQGITIVAGKPVTSDKTLVNTE